MRTVRLAYRDNDRTPVIYCIKAMAERHYAVNVDVVHIEPQQEFEAALFDNSCDVIIEHIEYLHTEAAKGKKITFFCAPQIHRGLKLVVPQSFDSVDELRGKTMAVRDLGRPHTVTLWLRKMGLEKDVGTIIVKDKDVGRWKQWKKSNRRRMRGLLRIAPLYVPDALAAGLKTFPVPEVEIVSNFAQACLSTFAHRKSCAHERLFEGRRPCSCTAGASPRRSDGDRCRRAYALDENIRLPVSCDAKSIPLPKCSRSNPIRQSKRL